MRIIDVDKITDDDICMALGFGYTSYAPGIRQLLDEQPTVKPQCIATINIKKEDIKENMAEHDRINEYIIQYILYRTYFKKEELDSIWEKKQDFYINSEDAEKYGIVNEVL